ncbi:DUF11 domain-containing protein [Parasphingopyxis sp. CP4]|uniref:choice-of-anchor X domain-containing protein n=1 Tax=Parasphingopyxis sp. CP4 TaxID=2724527 RepID=UPI0015A15BAF|nr:choice-of-anchor X domain-containing protein [Parasphingopyxis sp. CP4]QLC20829.1 DUF11 domain-containing protein [Parasphingopyxis sp. CP4]
MIGGRKFALGLMAIFAMILAPHFVAQADLRLPNPPGWYDPDGVATGEDWHYRVPLSIPASSSINSTIQVDVDFDALLAQMGVSGTFDANSVRVVRPNGSLVTVQEFTDTVFGGATDATGNGQGDVRFLLEDAGASTHYIYFDITQNGTKSANPQTPINGNFERGTTGAQSPTQWTGAVTNAAFDAQVRPSENVTVTTNGGGGATQNTDGTPNSGAFSYLIGSRTNNEAQNGIGGTVTRTITVPTTNPGNLTFRYRVEGWDSSDDGASRWDWLEVDVIGATTTQAVGPTAGNYVTFPFSPNKGTQSANTNRSGYGQYNGWDTDTNGVHRSGMTLTPGSEPWFIRTVSLAPYAGQTVTLRFRTDHQTQYRTWFHIDDVEWSVVTATLGTPEAFGVAVLTPGNGADFAPGDTLTIIAQVDANPTAATLPVTANIYDESGTLMASGIELFDDGTHGDATANDGIWTNDNSEAGEPTYTIPPGTSSNNNWTIRIFARDAGTSTIGAQNGLALRPGQPTAEIEANFWNIDDSNFDIVGAEIVVTKISTLLNDPINGAVDPYRIPGAEIRYCITITNNGPADASNVVATDVLPATLSYVTSSMLSGSSCGTAATAEDDDAAGADESDPIGASFSGGTITANAASLTNGTSIALVFRATVN